VKFTVTKVKYEQLAPGAAFSMAGPDYWEGYSLASLAVKVYIRTDAPLPPSQRKTDVFRITWKV